MTQGALDVPTEAEKRDSALDLLERTRADLIALARATAREMGQRGDALTSVGLIKELRARGHGHMLDSVDNRALGCVFRGGWEKIGYESVGSHARPCAVWVLKS